MAQSKSPPVVVHLSAAERASRGRAARKAVPRASQGAWDPPATRADPTSLLAAQETTRVPELVPIRHERMLSSPFAFYRGAAVIMAADLAPTSRSGLLVQCCGDAHLANFGGFSAPDRQVVFDINDFDETSRGPFEWDVKRLAASFEIAARSRGFTTKRSSSMALNVVRSYRQSMLQFAAMSNLDVWYTRLDVAEAMQRWSGQLSAKDRARVERNIAKGAGKDSLRAFDRLTMQVDGQVQIVNDPPLVVRVDDLALGVDPAEVKQWIHERFREYRRSLQPDRRHLLEGYELVDVARKVVGVGSVGTRCWIVLLQGKDDGDPLFLQVKEAEASVLEPHAGKSDYASHGQRVVEGQRLLQSASDILLGWFRATSPDGVERDYYVRQLWDGKISADLEGMSAEVMRAYAEMCGWTLARGHARSGDRIAIAAYLGTGDTFDRALDDFAVAYAEQNERDYDTVNTSLATPAPTG
ncbi:MAG TPA: DUF2252 domain-containing protein [Acidimicrobiia bacterium]|nr:DUF2252 domain-containing protein [Acidimicrobiia bacterium]